MGLDGVELGRLGVATPVGWAETAAADPLSLLNDHAHLEKKAALNALALMHRGPTASSLQTGASGWVRLLAAIARDETEHLGRVLRLLEVRGGGMSPGHRNPYAAALHRHVRTGQGPAEVADLVLVSALIEARSCERFALLRAHVRDPELQALYAGLEASERGHHRVFLELAGLLLPPEVLGTEWARWCSREADAIQAQPPGPTMHSGWSRSSTGG